MLPDASMPPDPSTASADLRLRALQRREQQLRLAEQVAGLGSFDWDTQTGELHWSDQHFRLWGLQPGALTPSYEVFRRAVHPDDLPDLEARLQQALADGGQYECRHRVIWPDGSQRYIHARGELMRDASSPALRMIGTVQDITAARAAEEALAASVDNLRLTLNATGDGIFASDADAADQPLLFVNDRLLQIWDIPSGQATSLTPAGVIAAAARFFIDPAAELARIRDTIASPLPHEHRLALNDGRVLMRRCMPTLAAGRRVRVWGFRDITAEDRAGRAVQAAEAHQRALLEAFPGFIARIDAEGSFTHVNQRLAALLDRPASAITGLPVSQVFPTAERPQMAQRLRLALTGQTVQFEHQVKRRSDRRAIQLLVTLAPGRVEPGQAPHCFAFGTDIQALKQVQADLVQARDEAERANRAKSAFLSNMSHELRTPMNAVLGFAQLLDGDAALGPAQRGQVQQILHGGQHLLALINDLLDLARVDAGKLSLRLVPLALSDLAAECHALLGPVAAQRGITISLPAVHDRTQVLADRTRLKQVLVNLLGNAVKYNHAGGWVRLDWSVYGDTVTLAVQDDGQGLDDAQQSRLFQPFERLGAEGGHVEGTGIGLALTRRLVELMQGQIGLTSAPGQGSTFWFTLRAAPSALVGMAGAGGAAAAVAAAPVPAGTAAGVLSAHPADTGRPTRTVLYIEDNPVNAMLMTAVLQTLPGVRTLHADTPERGLALAASERPDLVLLDIQLPGMDGFEVLARLRAQPQTAGLLVMAVTANAMPQDQARGRAAGFAAYLTKPLDMPVLLREVTRALGLPLPARAAQG